MEPSVTLEYAPRTFRSAVQATWVSLITELVLSVQLSPATLSAISACRTVLEIVAIVLTFTKASPHPASSFISQFCEDQLTANCLLVRRLWTLLGLIWLRVSPLLLPLFLFPLFSYTALTLASHSSDFALPPWTAALRSLALRTSACVATGVLCGGAHVLLFLFVSFYLKDPPSTEAPLAPWLFDLGLWANILLLITGYALLFVAQVFGLNWRGYAKPPLQRLTSASHLADEALTSILALTLIFDVLSLRFLDLFTVIYFAGYLATLVQSFQTPFRFHQLHFATFFICDILRLSSLCLAWLFRVTSSDSTLPPLSAVMLKGGLFGVVLIRLLHRLYFRFESSVVSRHLTAWTDPRQVGQLSAAFSDFEFLRRAPTAPSTFGEKGAFSATDLEIVGAFAKHVSDCPDAGCPCAEYRDAPIPGSKRVGEFFRILRRKIRLLLGSKEEGIISENDLHLAIQYLDCDFDSLQPIVDTQGISRLGLNWRQKTVWSVALFYKKVQTIDRRPIANTSKPENHADVARLLRLENQVHLATVAMAKYIEEFGLFIHLARDPVLYLANVKTSLRRLHRLGLAYKAVVKESKDNWVLDQLDQRFKMFARMNPDGDAPAQAPARIRNSVDPGRLVKFSANSCPSPEFLLGEVEPDGDIRILQTSSCISHTLGWSPQALLRESIATLMCGNMAAAHKKAVQRFVAEGKLPPSNDKVVVMLNNRHNLIEAVLRMEVVCDFMRGGLLVFTTVMVVPDREFFVCDDRGDLIQVTPALAERMKWPVRPGHYRLPFYRFFEKANNRVRTILDYNEAPYVLGRYT